MNKFLPKKKSKIFTNSAWGLAGSIVQNVFLSLFYILLARHFSVDDFSKYIIASSLYQVIVAFSAMGLGHWFIREVVLVQDKNLLIRKFLKMQALFGIFFFVINIITALVLYDEALIQGLSLLFAINIIFDNIIYSIKYVNIAEFAQKKTVRVLSIEAIAKFGIACLLFIYPFSIFILTVLLVVTRFFTLNLFLKIGAAEGIELSGFWKADISWSYIKSILYKHWPFAIIGSAYVIYWRSSTIIISKMLPIEAVAHYENSFKIFSLAQLVPVVLAGTLLPRFVELIKDQRIGELRSLYEKMFKIVMVYGIAAFTFTYSFADVLLPLAFGDKYAETPMYTKEMFFTMLVFPTSLLQANMLIAMKLEKLDMWFNINSVVINSVICLVGLSFIKSLSVVNYSIFVSFIIFHLSQDYVLVKKKIIDIRHVLSFIGIVIVLTGSYIFFADYLSPYILFILFWLFALPICFHKELKMRLLK